MKTARPVGLSERARSRLTWVLVCARAAFGALMLWIVGSSLHDGHYRFTVGPGSAIRLSRAGSPVEYWLAMLVPIGFALYFFATAAWVLRVEYRVRRGPWSDPKASRRYEAALAAGCRKPESEARVRREDP